MTMPMPPETGSASPLIASYLENRAMLLRYFVARTRDSALAQEIVQDVYLKIAQIDPDHPVENTAAFLFKIAHNLWLNQIRSDSRRYAREDEWIGSQTMRLNDEAVVDEPSVEAKLGAEQEMRLVKHYLNALPDRTRTIFRLHKFDGLTQAEVAAKLGISKSSVEKHLHQAIGFLLVKLKRAGVDTTGGSIGRN
jgi:RNA polymerase sigma factor (sigma-70 family)